MLKFPLQTLQRGAVAQLEEYLNGIQGVVGSNPISSTNFSSKGVQGSPGIILIRRSRNQEIFIHLQTIGRDDDGGDILAVPLSADTLASLSLFEESCGQKAAAPNGGA